MARMNFSTVINPERISRIAAEVQEIADTSRDFCVDRRNLRAAWLDNELVLSVHGASDTPETFSINKTARTQMLSSLKIPGRFADRLIEGWTPLKGEQHRSHGDLLASTMTTLLAREPKRHLVRTVGGRARAFLSDAYMSVANADLLAVALQEITRAGAKVYDLRHTDDGSDFRICAVHPDIVEVIQRDPRAHGFTKLPGVDDDGGDIIYPAMIIGNSETGEGRLRASSALLRDVCSNFCAWGQEFVRVHIGKRRTKEEEIIWSDETKALDEKLIAMKVRDQIRATFDQERFREAIAELSETTTRVFEKATETVDATIDAFSLPKERREAILETLLQSGDKTQFGLGQALSAQVNPDNRGDADDATINLFEDAASGVLQLTGARFAAKLAR